MTLKFPLLERTVLFIWLLWFALVLSLKAAESVSTSTKQGGEMLKTDIMAVFAHPDDETGMAATLASYGIGRTSVVANVYCTRGEGGGNMVGTHSGTALGHLREAELRDCLSILGVRFCYFLDCLDWAYTESASATLEKWNKEQTLAKLVRLVRTLRPDLIVTMNPAPNPGQHGHHQAAGILATEAFAAAADPARFPSQLDKEGLHPWQARKLFYGGGNGSIVTTIDVSRTMPNGEKPSMIAARALANHRSQAFGSIGNSPWLQRPQRFTLVKSFVPVDGGESDLLAGSNATNLSEVKFRRPTHSAMQMGFVPRPAVANYLHWATAQGIEHVSGQFNADLPVVSGAPNVVALELANRGGSVFKGTVRLSLPEGWSVDPESKQVSAAPGTVQQLKIKVSPPANAAEDIELRAILTSAAETIEASAKLHPVPLLTVARVSQSPSLDRTDARSSWDKTREILISHTNVWQGKVRDAQDNSASFRLAHDRRTLFVDVAVKDDMVVSNIAPDDIRGHWRSDSVELCIDPGNGAEHTMAAFKLGIFPFDNTGAVRAARDADANQGLREETAPRTRVVSWRTPDGYRIRAAIPFEEIGIQRGQKRLAFNLLLYDGDKADAAPGENINKSRLAWSPRSGVMGRPEDWGRIELE